MQAQTDSFRIQFLSLVKVPKELEQRVHVLLFYSNALIDDLHFKDAILSASNDISKLFVVWFGQLIFRDDFIHDNSYLTPLSGKLEGIWNEIEKYLLHSLLIDTDKEVFVSFHEGRSKDTIVFKVDVFNLKGNTKLLRLILLNVDDFVDGVF